jgi:hypothetical protein
MKIVLLWLAFLTLALPPALEQWRADIESAGGTPVYVAEVEFSPDGEQMTLPDSTPARPLFAQYLRQEDFVRQFVLMRGVLIHHQGPDGQAHLVLLNGARRPEWGAHEDALIAHEFGHAWLRAKGYPAPVFQPGPLACLAIHTGDIVQHVLIRREMEARGIDHLSLWLASLEAATAGASPLPDGEGIAKVRSGDPCLALRQTAEWADVRLGFAGSRPEIVENYELQMRRIFPDLEPAVSAIADAVRSRKVEDPQQHLDALQHVHTLLRRLLDHLATPTSP